ISVFVEPLQGAKPLLEGGSQMGAMNAFGTVVADHQVLVVGEVPQSTVALVGGALAYRQEDSDD
ncbi:MAG: MucB/RseB C-terminal domain-containing protein, partial [Candidatus Competibacteraceae bacterium]|nr:MucB/RseB C-terminal domain-containing protein [Candidatus Competibacteraceae bacterium]